MKFEFDNLGPIKYGQIELGKLTVFCGKNNTGKTYVNYLIYGFYYYLRQRMLSMEDKLQEAYTIHKDYCDIHVEKVAEILPKIKEQTEREYQEYLPAIFKVKKDFFQTFSMSVQNLENDTKNMSDDIYQKLVEFSLDYGNLEVIRCSSKLVRLTFLNDEAYREVGEEMEVVMTFLAYAILYDFMFASVYMLPAERNGLNMFYRELNINRNQVLFDAMSHGANGLLKRSISKYPLPISEYINMLNAMDSGEDEEEGYADVATSLEEQIIYGKFLVNDNGSIQFKTSQDRKLDFHLTSSTAKSLFGLDYLLRHDLKEGCYLIIDEPEQNLHPDNQRYIARILARLSNAGVNVIISTHSDYIIKELNNLIMLKQHFKGYERLMEEYQYEEDELLDQHDIKAYVFKESTTKEVGIDDEGMRIWLFDDVISQMTEAANDIYNEYVEEGDEEYE